METPARKAASSIIVSSICNAGFCEASALRAPAKKFEVTPIPAQAVRKARRLACLTRLFISPEICCSWEEALAKGEESHAKTQRRKGKTKTGIAAAKDRKERKKTDQKN